MDETTNLHLDYKLTTCAERAAFVEDLLTRLPKGQLTDHYLEILGDYIMGAITKEEKLSHLYLTDNRLITINRRETSFEGMVDKFENGEDGFYNLIAESDRGAIFQHKQEISAEDIERVPGLKALRTSIEEVERQAKEATGKRKYLLKKQVIEMRRDQYILKNAYYAPMTTAPSLNKGLNKIDLYERRYVDENGEPRSTGLITFFNPDHVGAIMRHYNALKLETAGKYWDDFYYLLEDFDRLFNKALADYPMLKDIALMRMDNKSNNEIQQMLIDKYNKHHTVQYISSLYCQRIPRIIAEQEQNDFLIWYYRNEQKGQWKKCSCCKEYKLASARFFSKNKTSKDGFYSICKACRNRRQSSPKAE